MVNAKPAGKEECTLTTSCLPRVLIQQIVLSTWAGPGSWNGQGMPVPLNNSQSPQGNRIMFCSVQLGHGFR